MDVVRTLGTIDYVVLGGMLSVSLGIGVFFATRGLNTKEGYLMGNRQMGSVSVAVSMFVTLQSAISLLGVPAEVYTYGTMLLYLYVGMALVYITGMYTCLPLLYPLKITSVYEYLGRRFGSHPVRLLGTYIGMLQTLSYMAIALLSPGLALQAVAGIPLWWSIVIVGIIGTVYTSIGGIKSVVWTDVFQSVVMLFGMIVAIVLGTQRSGGILNVFALSQNEGRIIVDDIDPDPRIRHTVWGTVIGGFFSWYVNLFVQSMVQRVCAVETLKGAKLTYLINVPLVLIYGLLLGLTGLVLFSYMYTVGCDPVEAGYVSNRNQLMPYFVIQVMASFPGMTGLYMSMLFSGALSTLSSGINGLAANTVEDLLGPFLLKVRASERLVTTIAKLAVCIYGLVAIGLAYAARSLQGPVTQMALSAFGACGGPVTGMFILGALFPWTNKYGAFIGGIVSLAINIWISISGQLYGRRSPTLHPAPTYACADLLHNETSFSNTSFLYEMTTHAELDRVQDTTFDIADLSYCWYGASGTLMTIIIGIIISLVTGRQDPKTLDPQLVFPFVRRFCKLTSPASPDVSFVSPAEYRAMSNYRYSWDMYKRDALPDSRQTYS